MYVMYVPRRRQRMLKRQIALENREAKKHVEQYNKGLSSAAIEELECVVPPDGSIFHDDRATTSDDFADINRLFFYFPRYFLLHYFCHLSCCSFA